MTVQGQSIARRPSVAGRLPAPLLFALIWLVLPNLVFVPLWILGGPPRPLAIMLYVMVGFFGRKLPLPAIGVLLLAVFSIDVVLVISGVFNLSPLAILYAIKFLPNLEIFASGQYFGLVALVAAVFAATLWLAARYRAQLAAASAVPALLAAALVMAGDFHVNATPELQYGRFLSGSAPFQSAMRGSGLEATLAAPTGRNLVVVMVESLGRLADPAHEKVLTGWLDDPALRRRFRIETGATAFYRSTTAAEIRELCGRWADYDDYMDGPAADCLPARLAAAGYRTTALHGFTGRLFERSLWYPNLGFQTVLFGEDMYRPGDRICPGVFAGLCDTDMAERIGGMLQADADRPQFIHWVTLNTHLPVILEPNQRRLDCGTAGAAIGEPMVCAMAELWVELFDKLAEVALMPGLPPTDFLIVGDHAPPFWIRRAKALFAPGEVPWIVLRDRRGE